MSENRREWFVIGRGWVGWHAQGVNASSSGGDIERRPWMRADYRTYLDDAIDGCLVYDGNEADETAFSRHVISGPMCNPALPAGHVNRFRQWPKVDEPCTPGEALTLKGFDYCSVDLYRSLLEHIPGIKIGTVRAGAIVWDWPKPAAAPAPVEELAHLFPLDPRD